jgi:hypothetical protein
LLALRKSSYTRAPFLSWAYLTIGSARGLKRPKEKFQIYQTRSNHITVVGYNQNESTYSNLKFSVVSILFLSMQNGLLVKATGQLVLLASMLPYLIAAQTSGNAGLIGMMVLHSSEAWT